MTRMVYIHERQLESKVDTQRGRSESSKVREFLHLAPPLFMGSSPTEDPKDFIDHMYRVLRVMHASVTEAVELTSFRLHDVPPFGMRPVRDLEDVMFCQQENCRVASLSVDVDISCIHAFAQTIKDLSQWIRDIRRDREQSKKDHTMGSYREKHGDFKPPFYQYPSQPAGSVSPQVQGPRFDRYSSSGPGQSSGQPEGHRQHRSI
ncbi:hypothetical protein MTR67_023315 [Solanum verrucosum]|uniref:Gag-pol polyprotein n=1 Tax=Solanum verrucosum TaxID=315347 RepID=A0AAF0QW85_SOLVR|nr:hypothetical protein MTR67_023315 [Solanum verrucosum]